ncbi:MAG TPA: hypothetical protein VGH38_15060, partial [Bryobacteraceae bacterium]
MLFLAWIPVAEAQQFEIGVLGGGGFLRGSAMGGAQTGVSAGFSPGPAAGILIGQNRYTLWSGEMRYLFEQRDPRITA